MTAPATVTVTRSAGDNRRAEIRFGALTGWHMARRTGGISVGLKRPTVAAYMPCTELPVGKAFGHSCTHGNPPHIIKVILLPKHNPGRGYLAVRGLAEHR